ncbi:hypothetical protein [Streptomyces sp. NPDC000994]
MEQHKEQALATAIPDGKIGHLQHWLTHWQVQVEIERRPELHARHHAALAAINESSDRNAPAFRTAMNDLHAVEAEARQAVSACPAGSPPPATPASGRGTGLPGLRGRVAALGGTLHADPDAREFSVTAVLPLE